MRKKIVLEYDASTGFVYDSVNCYIGTNLSLKPFEDHDGDRSVPIDDLVKLRNAGFTTEEIIELKRKELL